MENYSKPKNRPGTVKSNQGYIDRHIIPKLGALKVRQVTRSDVSDRRWLRLRLAFLDDLAIPVDDTNTRLIRRHVEPRRSTAQVITSARVNIALPG